MRLSSERPGGVCQEAAPSHVTSIEFMQASRRFKKEEPFQVVH